MNKYEALAKKLQNREKVIGTTMSMLNSPLLLEQMNRSELDFVLFDAEHGVFDTQNVISLLQVGRLMRLPTFVRAQDCEYHLIAKAIDMGADGVMVPRTETLEQLRTAVDALLFYPAGRKGCGGHGQFRPGEAFDDFGKTRFLMPQIESQKGIDMLPKMLEEYGQYISAVIIGPYDMSVMLDTPVSSVITKCWHRSTGIWVATCCGLLPIRISLCVAITWKWMYWRRSSKRGYIL